MTIRHLTLPVVTLAAVLAIGTGIAQAHETVRFTVPASFSVSTAPDTFLVVTSVQSGTLEFSSACMNEFGFLSDQPVVKCVYVEFTPGAAKTFDFVLKAPLSPGTRLTEITLIGSCNDGGTDFNIYESAIASPQNSEAGLTITPAGVSLSEEHEAVIGAASDELGIAAAVCVKQGSQSIKTPIVSDIALEAGDRLTDFVEVDVDLETGETMYACRVEY